MAEPALERARRTYSLEHWSGGHFDVGPGGVLLARPRGAGGPAIRLTEVVEALRREGFAPPVLLRLADILHHRVAALDTAFREAMAGAAYRGGYTPVYPVKVNQQRSVVEQILAAPGARVGLEAGSKPELLAVLALAPEGSDIVCNGYKDPEYVRLALIGERMGHRVHLVIEKGSELDLIEGEARAMGLRPRLGVRVRLASLGAGNWQNTGGPKAKFGLTAAQTLETVERLRGLGWLDRLELLHFHMGSQIANIRDIQGGLREGARVYVELHRAGVPIRTVDVGGGLGVDYEGTRSRSFCSINYGLGEYARNVVHALGEACDRHRLPHPRIMTEAGRALTAHHAVLVTEVIDSEPAPGEATPPAPEPGSPAILRDLWQGLQDLSRRSVLEIWHDAQYQVAEARSMFVHGLLDLRQRALAEDLYFAVCRAIRPLLRPDRRAHRAVLDELDELLADKYFCNFSVFQSAPDVWGIRQVFPIVPLHRLDEPPSRRAVIEDLTCDSDGRIDRYVDSEGVDSTLPVHPLRPGEPYLLGIFLVGAYQEILGDMHNLFGDTHAVDVHLDPQAPGGFRFDPPEPGDTVAEVLRYVHLDPDALHRRYGSKLAAADVPPEEAGHLLQTLEEGLRGYTYLEDWQAAGQGPPRGRDS